MDDTAAPLTLYRTTVPAEWVDYNGHMNDACYCIAFSRATDALIEYIGLDADYRERAARSVFTLESHVCYLREGKLGESLRVTVQLLGHDARRLRLFLALYRDGDDALLATAEQMFLHVDTRGPRAAPFDDAVQARVDELWAAHAALPVPEQCGRAIATLATDITVGRGRSQERRS